MVRRSTLFRVVGGLLLGFVFGATPLLAQFHPSTQLTDGSGGYSAPEMVLLPNTFLGIGSASSGTIVHANTAASLSAVPQLVVPAVQGDISLVVAAGFLEFMAYTQVDGSGGPTERDLYLASNSAGPFTQIDQVTADDADDHSPDLYLDPLGGQHLAWVSDDAGVTTVRYRLDANPIVDLATGESPQIAGLGGGDVVVVYARAGELFSRTILAGVPAAEVALTGAGSTIDAFSIQGLPSGDVGYLIVEGGSLEYIVAAPGTLLPAGTTLSAGPVDGNPSLAVDGQARPVVAWASGGEILWSRGESGNFPAGAPIGSEPAASEPVVVVDSLDQVHVAYLSAGEVWLTNNVPTPVADFSIADETGVLPVDVTLTNSSSGVIQFYEWDFGDGTTSTLANPSKTYTLPGTFSVSLTVTGPGGSDTFTLNNVVETTLPENVLRIANIIAFGGQPVSQPLVATHPDPLQGFQCAIRYNEGVTPFNDVNFTGTGVEALAPEFLVANIFPNGANSEIIIAVVFDFQPPFDGGALAPGVEQTIANLIYEVPIGNPLGTVGLIEFVDGLGSPPITNRFSTEMTESITPYFLHGSCTIDAQPQFVFFRGDANYNLAVDIADAIFILGYLFSGGAEPGCPDTADVNDDGQINIGDAIYLLGFLFGDGPTIPYPFPGFGLDPTPDNLGVCNP